MKILLRLRCIPIVLIAALGGTGLFVANPGLFWDDWVWWFQSPESNIQIGRELGIWWGGYLSNAIYSTENPVLTLRLTALLSWIFFALAFAYVARKALHLQSRESFELFLMIVASHLGLIRFLNSVALYNVYIASFWIAVALIVKTKLKTKLQYLSIPFFFFSFYLNSFIAIYGLILSILFLYHVEKIDPFWDRLQIFAHGCFQNREISVKSTIHNLSDRRKKLPEYARKTLTYIRAKLQTIIVSYLKTYWLFVLLPIFFVAHKKITKIDSELYGNYNEIHTNNIIGAITKTFSALNKVLRSFFEHPIHNVPSDWILVGTLIALLAITAMPREQRSVTWRQVFFRLLAAVALAYVSLFPYVVVNKPPQMNDFYESRHVLVVIPALILLIHTLTISIGSALFKNNRFWHLTKNLFLAILIGGSLSSSVMTATQLWEDWYRQKAILNYLETNAERLSNAKLFLFQDYVPMKIWNRKIWNYEYTGIIVQAFGGRSRMGVSLSEYQSWPKEISLLKDKKLKERFNMGEFNFKNGFPVVSITTTINNETPQSWLFLYRLLTYIFQNKELHTPSDYVNVSASFIKIDTEDRINEMKEIRHALYKYRKDHGSFPYSNLRECGEIPERAYHTIKAYKNEYYMGAENVIGNIPGLFPDYITRPPSMGWDKFPESYYIYMSDGINFKLIYVDQAGIAYTKQAHPALLDKRRPDSAYGFWTDGGLDW